MYLTVFPCKFQTYLLNKKDIIRRKLVFQSGVFFQELPKDEIINIKKFHLFCPKAPWVLFLTFKRFRTDSHWRGYENYGALIVYITSIAETHVTFSL